jgi:hypothetical protein
MTSPSGFVATGVVLQRDHWYHLITRVDYAAQTYSVIVDGQVAGTVGALSGAALWGHAFTSLMFIQPGDDQMYIDGFSLVTHDGSGVSTYCTAGLSTHGCSATLSAAGSPSAGASSGFVVSAAGVEGAASATFFYGRAAASRCRGRRAARASCASRARCSAWARATRAERRARAAVSSRSTSRPTWPRTAARSDNRWWPESASTCKAWYRDPPAPKSTNLSNALEFTLLP